MPCRLGCVLAVCALGAFASGCGDARERQQPSASPELSKQEFIERADEICLRTMAKARGDAASAKRDRDAALERFVNRHGRMIHELRALPVPAGDRRDVRALLARLDRLQRALRAIEASEGEDALVRIAAMAVEMDAVARAAERYGVFGRCGAYQRQPSLARIQRGSAPDRLPPRPLAPKTPRLGADPVLVASALVPSRREVLRRSNCTGSSPGSPRCAIVELGHGARPLRERRAELTAVAARKGWTEASPTGGRGSGVLLFYRDDYEATVWVTPLDCAGTTHVGDGPAPQVGTTRCVDTIMVIRRG